MTKKKFKQKKTIDRNPKKEPQDRRTGADEIANKFIDYLLKELEELKEENKELKENYENIKEEYNEIMFKVYGIYPGTDEL